MTQTTRRLRACARAAALAAGLCAAGSVSAETGADIFNECAPCHSLKDGVHEVGPSLHALFGRKAAAIEGFRFSNVMKRTDLVWNDETLDRFLADPQAMFVGNKMPFAGMSDPARRAALIGYLKDATK